MIRVLIVEDSPTIRMLLEAMLDSDPEIEVIGTAADGEEGVRKTKALKPDLITMDIRMPRMDGFEATKRIMAECPTPIVVVSASVEASDLKIAFNALQAGALDVVEKPPGIRHAEFETIREQLVTAVKLMSDVKVVTRRPLPARPAGPAPTPRPLLKGRIDIIAIAASTGGPAALAEILTKMPAGTPVPILIVQHITRGFDEGLVRWMDSVSPLPVRLAVNGQRLRAGEVLVGPQGVHLGVSDSARVVLSQSPSVQSHCPSATYLFRSVAEAYGRYALGVILTGMGDDGVDGLVALKRAGGRVLAQDEDSSVVFGMPRQAIARGVVDQVVPLSAMAATIVELW